jgi:hypothetical protein
MFMRSRRDGRQSRRFALWVEPLEDRNLLSGAAAFGGRWSEPPPDPPLASSEPAAAQQPVAVDRSSEAASTNDKAANTPRTNSLRPRVVTRAPAPIDPGEPEPPDVEPPPPGDTGGGSSTPPRDRGDAPPLVAPGSTPTASPETAERPQAPVTAPAFPVIDTGSGQQANPRRSEVRANTTNPEAGGDTQPATPGPDALPAGGGSLTVFAVHAAEVWPAAGQAAGQAAAAVPVPEPILAGEMPPPTEPLGAAQAPEPATGLEVWNEAWLVDVQHLEALLGAFLAGLDRLGLPQAVASQGVALPMWILSLGLAAVACEVARRQLRRHRLALAGDVHPRLADVFVPPPEE